ncbi:breast cancer anti-estrogen resistance protein 3 isoform X1 [Lates japonicus]|uniref:Breast cancer anti-estrogen resistance protein 3 isoform X1 n=1 Tax=Lates japonicus TaxID=270547 RepID=A0AAD3MZV7_LATJO|nr:breast cancer anti-estrogen resistance protein 3 isoform X1 [Lates japonicus]
MNILLGLIDGASLVNTLARAASVWCIACLDDKRNQRKREEATLTELRMMAEGRFASLPRSLHAHHTLEGGTGHPGVPSPSLGVPSSSTYSSRRLQASLASSMDLLSSRPGLPPGQGTGLSELPAAAYQPISIHGTLPRRKRGGTNLAHRNYTWDPRANHMQPLVCGKTSLAPGHIHQPLTSPLVQNIIDDFHSYREPATPDATGGLCYRKQMCYSSRNY